MKTNADGQRQLVLEHIAALYEELERRPSVQDYNDYRKKVNKERAKRGEAPLPSMSAVYRMFGKWPQALAAAGIDESERVGAARASDEELIHDLKYVANATGGTALSTHMYDNFRRTHPPIVCGITGKKRKLFSSSVIRKWLGDWPEAVAKAGLTTSGRVVQRRLSQSDIRRALQMAKRDCGDMLTQRTYSIWYSNLSEEERQSIPDTQQILNPHYPSWEAALADADVDQTDLVHPSGWTSEEARRISKQVRQLTVKVYKEERWDEKTYEFFRARSRRPWPEWSVITWLLAAS